MLQALLNILDFGMSPQEAVEAPRFQSSHFYNSFGYHEFAAGKVNIEGRIPRATSQKLAEGTLARTKGTASINDSKPCQGKNPPTNPM